MADQSHPLTPAEIAALLRSACAVVRAELAELPAAAVRWHPAPGEWCVLEVLGHLIEAEQRGFAGRIRIILEHDESTLEAWDQVAVARARRDCERDPTALLDEFATLRAASAALVAGLRDSDLRRGAAHPTVGHLRVGDLLHEWIHDDRNHVKQLLANVQEFVWPHMGNAQRFSRP